MAERATNPQRGDGPVRQALAAYRRVFMAVAGFSLAINVLMLAAPLYMMQVFDRVLASRSMETLVMLTIVAGGALLVMAGLEMVRSRVLLRVSIGLEQALSTPALAASIANILGGRGQGVQALRDLSQIRNFLTSTGVFALFDAPWTPLFILVTYLFHPMLGAIAVAGAVVLFGAALLSELLTRGPLSEATAAAVTGMKRAEAGARNADAVEAMGMLGGILRRWQADNLKVLVPQNLASERAGYIVALVKLLRLLLQIAIFGVGAYLAVQQEITPGVMVAASLLMARALAPVEAAVGTWRSLVGARGAYRRLNDLLAATPRRGVAMRLPAPGGQLSVERLVYLPPGAETAALKGVSFELDAGDALGVIGPTAAGKSTLAKLMVGSWQPYAGKVRLDGADVYTWERADFGRYVGYLPQDVELFAGTVRENIARLGEVEAQAVVEAANLAGVHEMILRLPKGYETEIGEGGEVLAAGQRQLIALARALLGPPRLLVLDEPNSNLDSEGEKSLLAALAAAKSAGITVVIIAHRPSILEFCDKMLVLRNGVVEMFGAREEVMAKTARPAPRLAESRTPRLSRLASVGPASKAEENP